MNAGNGRLYDAKLGRFLAPDNFVQDPYNTQNFNRYSYVLNNPLSFVDPDGENPLLVAALIYGLIGSAVAVAVNGVANLANGDNFFQGADLSAFYGFMSGVASFGIGSAISGAISGASSTFAQTALKGLQVLSHAHLGGIMTGIQGGNYWHGFASGGVGSVIAGSVGSMFDDGANKLLQGAAMIGAGGLSGGVGSVIAGGNFWDGARNGLISAGLNHVAHILQQDPLEARFFKSKKAAYDYAIEQSILLDMGDGYVLTREVSGWILENGEYMVLDPSDNTYRLSYNRVRILSNGKMQVKYLDKYYTVKGHFHLHPNHSTPSGGDVYNLHTKYAPNNISTYILYGGSEYQYTIGNQYTATYRNVNYSYSLKNLGKW